MRTNIEIDDKLMAEVMAIGDYKTKREAVEEGLRMLVLQATYQGLRALRGQLVWDDGGEAPTDVAPPVSAQKRSTEVKRQPRKRVASASREAVS